MKKKKISELAKEFNLQNKQVMEMIKNLGIEGKSSASSALDEKELDMVLDAVMFSFQVEDFSMYAAPKKEETKPKKQADSKEAEKQEEQDIIEVIEKPIEKKVRYVDTRQNTIDESRLDDTKIEKMMEGTDIYATGSTSKQKIKKGGKNQKFERPINLTKTITKRNSLLSLNPKF